MNICRVSKELYAPALGGIMLSIGIGLSIDDFALAFKRCNLVLSFLYFIWELRYCNPFMDFELLPMFFSFLLLQTFTIVSWVHYTICAEASSWSINCKSIWHVSDVLCRLCAHILCCRSSAV